MNALRIALLAVLFLPVAAMSQEAKATLLEGKVTIIRGTMAMQGVEGMVMRQGDIVENPGSGIAQIELSGSTIIVLGPATRAYFPKISGTSADAFLLSGWLKSETTAKSGASRFSSSLLNAAPKDATLVFHAASSTSEIFVESGTASISEPGSPAKPATAGQFISRKAGKTVRPAQPDSDFLGSMPVPFRDTFPSRWSRFQGSKPPDPKRDHEVSYEEIQSWLTVPTLRHGFAERFQSRAKDPAFRRGIESHLGELPDWDRILHPEKYNTSPAPASNDHPSTKQGEN
jgi:hypothetical protein